MIEHEISLMSEHCQSCGGASQAINEIGLEFCPSDFVSFDDIADLLED